MSSDTYVFRIKGFVVNRIVEEQDHLQVAARSTATKARCPTCRRYSHRVHSYYTRRVRDLPIQGQPVCFLLQVRRFRCLNATCPRRTFAESISEIAPQHAQRSEAFTAATRGIGLSLGGEAGQRLSHRLHLPLSADTLLRIIRATPAPVPSEPLQAVGVDDWALRRSALYGTLVVDLERHQPIELLPDRTADTLAAYLREHSPIAFVSRDRSTEYRRGISLGAPQAVQIADRWHLLKNLQEVLERILAGLRVSLRDLPPVGIDPVAPRWPRETVRSANERTLRQGQRERRLERFEQVRTLHAQGLGILRIAKTLHMSRVTVRTYLKAEAFPEMAPRPRASRLRAYEPYLRQRWQGGCRNASQLWREIREQGFPGGRRQAMKWVRVRREVPRRHSPVLQPSVLGGELKAAPAHKPFDARDLPSTRKLAWLLMKAPGKLDESEALWWQQIQQHPTVALSQQLAQQFINLIAQRKYRQLTQWIRACQQSENADWASFATGIETDGAAVKAALRWPWNNGQLEGQLNTTLKLIKRQMYGRAKFDLLRTRVLSET
jgi:transposase